LADAHAVSFRNGTQNLAVQCLYHCAAGLRHFGNVHWICGALFGMILILNSAPHTHTQTNTDPIQYAATSPNQLQRCILTDYFSNYNFRKPNGTLPDDGDW